MAAIPPAGALRVPALRAPSSSPSLERALWDAPPIVSDVVPYGPAGFGLVVQDGLRVHSNATFFCDAQAAPTATLLMTMEAFEQRIDGRIADQRRSFDVRPNFAALIPAGADSQWRGRWGRDLYLHVVMAPHLLHGLAAEEGLAASAAELPVWLPVQDPTLSRLLDVMRAHLAEGDVPSVVAEHWVTLVALRLMAMPAPPKARPSYVMAPHKLAAVRAYIEANIAEPITLADLAAVAGLSRFHFARAFRRETGQPPHTYLTMRRCEHAKRMLAGSEMPVREIARACGFPYPSGLAVAFRRMTGLTPLAWRRAAR